MNLRGAGLRLDQAPPLAVPAAFFLIAPIGLVAAGGLLLAEGAGALATPWAPATLALTHLGTLGLLAPVMMGALYQLAPVLAGAPVGRVRLAHVVQMLWAVGVAGLASGLLAGTRPGLLMALSALTPAVVVFLVQLGLALGRAPTRNQTVQGMRLAVGLFALVAFLGIWMAHGHLGDPFPGPRGLWIQVHLCAGLLGWVGGLLTAVSWQILPMFYLARPFPSWTMRAGRGLVAAGVLLPVGVLALQWAGVVTGKSAVYLAGLLALPAVFAVWVLHPVAAMYGLAHRRRRRPEPSLTAWRVGLAVGPVLAVLAVLAVPSPNPRFGLLLGWLAIFGWAGMIIHGMLTRIVPFLGWFHWYSALAGKQPVPSLRDMLPARSVRVGTWLHLVAVGIGVAAILTGADALARLAGGGVLATGMVMGAELLTVLGKRPARAAVDAPIRPDA